ncbi:MAG: tol-pal system YbgF family protein [Nitrospiria bacterium]
MPYKIRVQKKKEADPVRIASRTEVLIESVVSNPKRIWAVLAVIALIAVGVFSSQSMKKRSDEAAWAIEAEASKLLHEPPPLPEPIQEGEAEAPQPLLDPKARLKRAAALYDEILEKYPQKSVAAIALFESGNAYAQLESYDIAEERFLSFLTKYPDRNAYIALVHMKLGYIYLNRGMSADALTHFRTVYEMPPAANKDQAGFELARTLESDGKVDEAVAIYSDISETYGESPWGTEAEVRLTFLRPPAPAETLTSEESEEAEGPKKNEAVGEEGNGEDAVGQSTE